MLVQALDESQKVVLLRVRYLHQLVLVIVSEEIVSRFLRPRLVSLEVTGEQFVEIVFVRQAPHELAVVDLVDLSE